jgi:hypothetical protein
MGLEPEVVRVTSTGPGASEKHWGHGRKKNK